MGFACDHEPVTLVERYVPGIGGIEIRGEMIVIDDPEAVLHRVRKFGVGIVHLTEYGKRIVTLVALGAHAGAAQTRADHRHATERTDGPGGSWRFP